MNSKHYTYKFFILLFLLAASNYVWAQYDTSIKRYRHFTTKNGLSNNSVYSLLQDQYGFIWIGTANGLNRFDGYEFKHFKNKAGDSSSISSNVVYSLLMDRNGFIWAGTNNGLNKYDATTETFKQYRHSSNNHNSIANNQVNFVYEDKEGYIWVGTDKTFDRLDPKENIFTHYTLPTSKIVDQSLIVKEIIEYDDDLLISVWGEGVYRFNRKTNKFYLLSIIHREPRDRNWVHHFYIDKKNNLFATDGTLLEFDKSKNLFRIKDDDKERRMEWSINCIAELQNGEYITGTTGMGYKKYNNSFKLQSTHLLDKDTGIYTVLNNTVEYLLANKSGEIWFAMLGNGLFLFDANQKKFEGYEHQFNNKNSISAGPITSIFATEQGEVLTGNRLKGLNIFNPFQKKFTHITENKNGLNSPFVKAIFVDKQKNKWIGTWGGGLNRMDAITGKYSYFRAIPNSKTDLQDNFVTSICESKDGRIWVATTRGVSVLEAKSNNGYTIKSFVYESRSNKCPAGLRTDVIICDNDGNIWIGTEANGLSRYDASKNSFTFFFNQFNNKNSLGSNKVQALFEDNKKRLWVGCSGGGLNLYTPDKNNFIRFNELDGLPSDNIMSITEDNNGKLWLGTDKGLSRFDFETKTFTNYNEEDGLLSNQFLQQAIYKSPVDGKLFAGTQHGLVAFYPDSILNNKFIPPVYINFFKKYLTKEKKSVEEFIPAIQLLDKIKLQYYENTFTVGFVSLNYSNNIKNQYAYKMEGLNNNWVQLGTSRELTFSNLPTGTYTLYVKASNSDLVWNEKGASLTIQIMSPWWRTRWAYLMYAILISGAIYLFIKRRINQRIKRLEEQQALRTKISSDLHDDVGTILSGLAMQSQMLTYSAKEEQKEPLLEISNMSHDAMEKMRDTVWAIDSRKDKYENLIDRMRDFAEKNLALKNLTHQFEFSDVDFKKFINPEKRQALYLIFKEAITNIIKHSDGKHVNIHFSKEKNKIILKIKDNGSQKESSKSDGLGLSNMKMRAENIGGAVHTKYDNGFIVEIVI